VKERERGRFLLRTAEPKAYWVGMRVQSGPTGGRPPAPTMIIARIDSFRGVMRFLQLDPWLMGAGAALGLSVLFWLPLIFGITRAIGQLTKATEQIAEGRFDTRVAAERRDELGKLGDSVNRMAARLDAHMTGQKRFLGDVAHELCSPLARLQMASGILDERAPAPLQPMVADVRDEVQQMSALVNELLAFTKSGLKPRDVEVQPVDLAALVAEALKREAATERVVATIPAQLRVMAEPILLGRAIGNLVRNAVRYAGESGPINVTAQRANGHILIAVEDNGPGVPSGDLDRLGEPFFRPELARTRETGGVGLGLAIVRNSVTACGGEVRFTNRSPRGFRAELRLVAA
jgi:two-component system, OmpR family, sensor histidine kinase CpxA